ncbi:MAG: noncanonical pyrimidine nucleotidase, YjjG family [bacterium]|nr:noncanonical pyrimidine nucleotidase, YjjG family [bacterium]
MSITVPAHYSTILLDFDHTLLDSDTSEIEAYTLTLRNQGVGDPMVHFDLYKKINLGLWAAVERGECLPTDVKAKRFELLMAELGREADIDQMADDFVAGFATHGDLYPGAIELLEDLSGRVSLTLISNGLSEVQRPRIARFGIEEYFDAIVISAEVGTTKPGTRIFDIAFEQLGNPSKATAIIVGDSLSSDIKGGADYGIATCWYNPNGKTAGPEDIITHEIKSLEELLTLV